MRLSGLSVRGSTVPRQGEPGTGSPLSQGPGCILGTAAVTPSNSVGALGSVGDPPGAVAPPARATGSQGVRAAACHGGLREATCPVCKHRASCTWHQNPVQNPVQNRGHLSEARMSSVRSARPHQTTKAPRLHVHAAVAVETGDPLGRYSVPRAAGARGPSLWRNCTPNGPL